MMLDHSDAASFFDLKYRATTDPWSAAHASRDNYYDLLMEMLERCGPHFTNALDVGCGEGYFTQRLTQCADHVTGIDVSPTAIQRASEHLGGESRLDFHAMDIVARDLETKFGEQRFDLIVCSQVLYYYPPEQLTGVLARLSGLLSDRGVLLVANTDEGNRYNLDEMLRLVVNDFSVLEARNADSHALIVARTKRPQLCMTVDYEGWDDPAGCGRIGVPDVTPLISATNQLLETTERHGGRLTLFVEVAQIDFWQRYEPSVAAAMIEQVQDAYRRGHGIELHLHLRWLTSLGATFDSTTRQAVLANDKGHLATLSDQELEETLTWADGYLRQIIQPVDDCWRPAAFRAGAYQIQPHEPVFRVLGKLGYKIDSSVWQGGYATEKEGTRGFDFRHLWTSHEPYIPSVDDINLPAESSGPSSLLEMPVASLDHCKLSFDSLEAESFCRHVRSQDGRHIVAIGHSKCLTKAELEQYELALDSLREDYTFASLRHAALDYECTSSSDAAGHQRSVALAYFQRTLPSLDTIERSLTPYNRRKLDFATERIGRLLADHDHVRVLDFGCGTGELFTLPLAARFRDNDKVEFTAFDVDSASVLRLEAHTRRNRLSAVRGVSDETELTDAGYDLVCNLEVLEHLDHPQPVVDRLVELVAPGGLLYLTVPNGYGPSEIESRFRTRVKQVVHGSNLLLSVGLRLKRRLKKYIVKNHNSGGELPLTETLHVANNVHVQRFRRRDIKHLIRSPKMRLVEQGNTAFLTGLGMRVCGIVPGAGRLNDAMTNRVFARSASGWYFVYTKPERNA